MNCPRCQLYIINPGEAFCPRCGYAFQLPQADTPTTASSGAEASYAPPTYPSPLPQPISTGAFPGYGAPPSGSLYGPGMPPPAYRPYPLYPAQPPYGVAAPVAKGRNRALIGLLVALIVAVVAGSGALVYLVAAGQHGVGGNQGATAAATATATPEYIPLLNDPLTSNQYGWPTNSHCFFSGSSYHVKDGYYCYAPLSYRFGNGKLSVDVKQVSGDPDLPYGLFFRAASNGNFYVFLIVSNGSWGFYSVVGNNLQEIRRFARSEVIHQGLNATNTLEVLAKDSHFDFFINGVQVGQADDGTYVYGGAGVTVFGQIEVAFNNFYAGNVD